MGEEKYMQRALDLAGLGQGHVSPNPMVGCVIVHEGRVIGEGYHRIYGQAHAEVNAIDSVSEKHLLKESTLYVTLEPCAHYGKTPPCADLIVRHGIPKVAIATRDPFEAVNGKGIERLKENGVEVATGMLESKARTQNRRFFTFHEKKRPYVILKWAQTADGFVARENGDSKWISNNYSRQLVHKWRAQEASILVGKNTALADQPLLTTRDWSGENPVRILLDSQLNVPEDNNILNDEARTLIFNTKKSEQAGSNEWIQVGQMEASDILKKLWELRIQSVLAEGGAQVLSSFIQTGLWDEARIFKGLQCFGKGIPAPEIHGKKVMESSIFEDTFQILNNNNG